MELAPLRSVLRQHGQEHVLAFWERLSAEGRAQLQRQLAALDLAGLAALVRGRAEQPDWHALARRAQPPHAMRARERELGRRAAWGPTSAEARARGAAALAAGQTGVLLVAGGQGSRLGFEQPKGLYPIGPLSRASLLQIHFEKTRAAALRYRCRVPLYLMTSPLTHEATVSFLEAHRHFGYPAEDVLVFCQGTMPAVDAASGKLLLAAQDALFLSPDGHGGTIAALQACGAIADMRQRGVQQLFYLQVDNPLAPIADEEFIGHHLLAESELTSLAVAKQSPDDKLGNFVTIDGKCHVIEYSDFPTDVAERRDAAGELCFWAGSVAIHVFDVEFLARSLTLADALPFHVALKKAPFIDAEGKLVEPAQPNALKFERFIFDLLPHARRPIVVEYREEDAFAPLKNASGAPKDTPEYVRAMMLGQHRRWLAAAGAVVPPGVDVEISPLFARDAREAARRVAPGTRFDRPQYLSPAPA